MNIVIAIQFLRPHWNSHNADQSVLNLLKTGELQGFENSLCISSYNFINLLKMVAP